MTKYRRHLIAFILAIIIAALVCPYDEGVSSNASLSIYKMLTGRYPLVTVILDDKGIPINDYGSSIGKQRNPVTISQTAFDYWDEYQAGNKEARGYFLNCADWLVENAISYDGYTAWEYKFPWKDYNMTSPWRSGMAQGQGIQVLTRAYNITGNQDYLNVAKLSLQSFYVEVAQGGVSIRGEDGWWYEEYADEGGSDPKVLNGMIFALLGIEEYYERTGDQDAKFLLDKGIIALKGHLPDYDTGYWTYYNRIGKLAYRSYHHTHVTQMSQLYNITNDPIFENYYVKWKGYEDNPNPLQFWLRFYHTPSEMMAAIYIVNFLPLLVISELMLFLIRKRKNILSYMKNR